MITNVPLLVNCASLVKYILPGLIVLFTIFEGTYEQPRDLRLLARKRRWKAGNIALLGQNLSLVQPLRRMVMEEVVKLTQDMDNFNPKLQEKMKYKRVLRSPVSYPLDCLDQQTARLWRFTQSLTIHVGSFICIFSVGITIKEKLYSKNHPSMRISCLGSISCRNQRL